MKDKIKEHVEIDINFIENYFEEYKLNVSDFLGLYTDYKEVEKLLQVVDEQQLKLPSSESKRFNSELRISKNHFEKISSIITPQLNALYRQSEREGASELLNDSLKNDLAIKGAFESMLTYTKQQTHKKERKQVLGE